MGQLMIDRHGGARLKYNLFVQPEEPDVKNGLWIQTPSEKGFKDVILKNNYTIAGTFNSPNGGEIPASAISEPYMVAISPVINGNIGFYVHDSAIDEGTNGPLIYNISTKTWQLHIINYHLHRNPYFFFRGKFYHSSGAPMYNMETLSSEVDATFTNGQLVPKISVLYQQILGADDRYLYYSDTSTNHFIIYNPDDESSITLGTTYSSAWYAKFITFKDTVIVFRSSSSVPTLRINNQTGTVSDGAKFPVSETISCTAAIGGKGYIFTNDKNLYTYDFDTDTFSLMDTFEGNVSGTPYLVPNGNELLLFFWNSSSSCFTAGTLVNLTSEAQKNGGLCLLAGTKHAFLLINSDKAIFQMHQYTAALTASNSYKKPTIDFSINDAWYYDTDFREYPTYVGDGTQWSKFKN